MRILFLILAVAALSLASFVSCKRPHASPTESPPIESSPTRAAATTLPIATSPIATSAVAVSDAGATANLPDTASRDMAMRAHAEELRRRLGPSFHIRYEWPFVAAGNLPLAQFNAIFEHSLMGSCKCLCRDYFTSEPDRLITVYLFKNDADYRRYADELFGDRPDTPYGYYSHKHRALIMNIGTGTGTLVHEMCHALIERDFPNYPSWFNEGLASLHEQCEWREGSLVGLPNWRLPALQEAIRAGEALPLKDVIAKTDAASFYEKDKGQNYATARYLCQYLQQRGTLKEFYALLRRNIATDPTGQKTLEKVFGSPLSEIEPAWRRWVMTLHFPE